MTDEENLKREREAYEAFENTLDDYEEKFGIEAVRNVLFVADFDKTFGDFEERTRKLCEAVKTGVPVKIVPEEKPEENPYTSWDGVSCGKELYDYWERFHEKFPIPPWGMLETEIKSRIEIALKTGIPVKDPPCPPDAII